MGTSKLSYLKLIRPGTVFSEGFENQNFLVADGWTTLQGTPANSDAQAKDGIKSWDNQASAGSKPVAKKVITTTDVDSTWMAEVWFYDDPTDVTSPGPYFKIKLMDGRYLSVGVRNSVSTTNISYALANVGTDEPTTASAAPRYPGWLRMSFWDLGIMLNGTVLVSFASLGSTVSEIYLCSDKIAGPGPSFGYFDVVGYYRSMGINLTWDSSSLGNLRAVLYSSANIPNVQAYGSPPLLFIPLINQTYPWESFMEIGPYAGAPLGCPLKFRSPLLPISPGDTFLYKSIDFERRVSVYKPTNSALAQSHQSTSGVTETLFEAYKNKYQFGVNNLEGLPIKGQLNDFYDFAVQGSPFSMMMDSSHYAFGVISTAPAVGTSTVTVMTNLGTHSTDAFEVGRQYVLFNSANTYRQQVTLYSTTNTQLIFVEPIIEPFSALDYCVESTYYPFLEIGNNPDGLVTKDERYLRWNWLQNCQDYNEA